MKKQRNVTIKESSRLRLHPLYVALFVLGAQASDAMAKDYFDPAFLGGANVDLSQYETAGSTPEGTYLVDIYINQNQYSSREVRFAKDEHGKVVPVMTLKDLQDMGVATDRIPALKGLKPDTAVGDISARIPSSTSQLDMSQLRLNISVPQADMDERLAGSVDPALWDEGIPAGVFNYNLNGSRNWMQSQAGMSGGYMQNLFGTATGGFNAGAWRLRSTLTMTDVSGTTAGMHMSTRSTQWSNTYLQRDIQRLRGELTLGENSTGADVLDSIPYRGVQLLSNDDMIPSSQRGFAPLITGIANSNAVVTVTQNGAVIYQTNVAPGPFRITDIYQASTGGDLVVTVTESDGSKHISTQAYSTLPVMQRPGGFEYEVTAGKYYTGGNGDVRTPDFALATLIYGLPYNITLYGGGVGSNDYKSAALGTGLSLGNFGAMSFDTTVARASIEGLSGEQKGTSWRARYSKSMMTTGTTIDVTTYRYSTSHYYSFADANSYGRSLGSGWSPWVNDRQRSSFSTNINQSMGMLGSVYVRATRDEYWGNGRVVNTVGAGFSTSIKGVGYNVNYNEDHSQGDGREWPTNRQVSMSVNVPFSLFSHSESVRSMSASYTMNHDNTGKVSHQTSLNGTLPDNKTSWNVSQSWDNQGSDASGNVGLNYSGDEASGGVGYGYDHYSKTVNANLSGGMLLHRHGIVLSQMMGDSVALVSAPGVDGVRVSSGTSSTNRWGYAASPYLQNYQRNTITLDPTSLPDGADIENTSVNVYPTKGAVVEAKFKTRIGRQAMLTLTHNGKSVPFGAMASLKDSNGEDNSSIVGDGGMVYLAGMPQTGALLVNWGSNADQQCRVNYNLGETPAPSKDAPAVSVVQQTLVCR